VDSASPETGALAGRFSQPGATSDSPLANIVTATRTGTATIELGPAPAGATNISIPVYDSNGTTVIGTFLVGNHLEPRLRRLQSHLPMRFSGPIDLPDGIPSHGVS